MSAGLHPRAFSPLIKLQPVTTIPLYYFGQVIKVSQKMELNKKSEVVWGDIENVRVCVIVFDKF